MKLAGGGALAIAAGIKSSLAAAGGASARPPDIIFLMTDQQRWDALGVLNPLIKTPALDRLAREGVLFRQAVCQAPSCIPSRNSMMFGLYPSQLGIRTNGYRALDDDCLPVLPLPERLRRAGYQTAGFGKTHWGRRISKNKFTSTRGFEVRIVGAKEVGMEAGVTRYQDDEDPQGLEAYNDEIADFGDGEEDVPGYIGATSLVAESDHRDGWVAERCLEFLDSDVDPKKPLFFYLSFLKPHAGLNVPKRFEDLYNLKDIPDMQMPPWKDEPDTHLAASDRFDKIHAENHRSWREYFSKRPAEERRRTILRYYANCSWLDSYFGQVIDRLEKLGRLKNAIIVFTSDHGEMLGERNYRFTKYCLYDSAARVPLLISGGAVPKSLKGTIDDRPAELVDLVPTLIRASGAAAEAALPGLDLLGDRRRSGSFCEYHDGGAPAYMWRTPEWKLILFFDCPFEEARVKVEQAKGELYDLRKDPYEWNNLYADRKHAEIREKLKTDLLMHLACAWKGFPANRPGTQEKPKQQEKS